jgi:hypothetical protein
VIDLRPSGVYTVLDCTPRAVHQAGASGLPQVVPSKGVEEMVFQLPKAPQTADNGDALRYPKCYYKERAGTPLGTIYTGARFDSWDSTGTRSADLNRFTSDDLVAVTFRSVTVPAKGCIRVAEQSTR